MKDQDSIFFKNFSIMLAALIVLTIILIIVGNVVHDNLLGRDVLSEDRTAVAKTIKPVAQVNTGDASLMEETAVAIAVAFDGSLDGKMIYDAVCMACHATGAAGAPKLETAAWADRMTVGIDGLLTSSINGIGAMPPRAGRPDLSDEQLKAAIEFMTNNLK